MIEDERQKKWRPTDRRASSPKRQSDVMKSKWPVTTLSAYQQCFLSPEAMDRKLRSLALGKVHLGHTLLALDKAMREWNPQNSKNGMDKDVYNALRSVREQVQKLQLKYPIEVK